MSYDLMAFSQEAAPKTKPEFMAWYDTQTKWTEEHGYNNPAVATSRLQAWLTEMEQTFPNMNGPNATDYHTSNYETDYCIGRVVIYAAFSWSLTVKAHEMAHRLAQKHQVGFYDSSFEGPILFPENGELKPIEEIDKPNPDLKKPWWRLW